MSNEAKPLQGKAMTRLVVVVPLALLVAAAVGGTLLVVTDTDVPIESGQPPNAGRTIILSDGYPVDGTVPTPVPPAGDVLIPLPNSLWR